MIKRRKMRLNGEWQLDSRNQVYDLRKMLKMFKKHIFRVKLTIIKSALNDQSLTTQCQWARFEYTG